MSMYNTIDRSENLAVQCSAGRRENRVGAGARPILWAEATSPAAKLSGQSHSQNRNVERERTLWGGSVFN